MFWTWWHSLNRRPDDRPLITDRGSWGGGLGRVCRKGSLGHSSRPTYATLVKSPSATTKEAYICRSLNTAMKLSILIACLMSALSWSASAQLVIVGVASVIDGDTLEVHGKRIRLHGIDAPESAQLCEKDGRQYRCGQQAALALSDKIGRASIRCEQRDMDRYKRIVAVCRLGNVDLNAWMTREGWAVAYRQYSRDYVDEESAARAAKLGIWAGRFVEPSKWRRGDRLDSERSGDSASGSCPIKGNISNRGERIYHVPGGRYYGQTRIDEQKGERWFCSEGEAQKAGWRRSRQ